MPLRPLDAEQWVARLIDWDNNRTIVPEALGAFGEYVAAACIPDPAPAEDGSVHRFRPPYCICGALSPRWPGEHWGGRCRDRRPVRRDQYETRKAAPGSRDGAPGRGPLGPAAPG